MYLYSFLLFSVCEHMSPFWKNIKNLSSKNQNSWDQIFMKMVNIWKNWSGSTYLVFTYSEDNIFHLFIRVVTEIMFVKIVLFLPILKQSFGKSVPILETKNLILNNGHKMPFLGFSTFNWKASPSRMKDAVYEAIKIGYRYKLFSHTVC